ncbi:hypothetical protein BDR22DRAFT_893389 [Usnea florida]
MHTRVRICPQCQHLLKPQPNSYRYLSTASAITPAAPPPQTISSPPPIARFPQTQPPSHKPPELRNSQLHRQYTSLLRSTPLLLFFQHSNLKSSEWMAIRRELNWALEKVDKDLSTNLAPAIKIQTLRVRMFESAFLVTEYFHPDQHPTASTPHPTDPATQSSASLANHTPNAADKTFTHSLSRTAHAATSRYKKKYPLRHLLTGPLAAMSFPSVTPQHVRSALSILVPKAPTFAAPTRRANPSYYDPSVQQGLQKLILLGARVEGRVFDAEGGVGGGGGWGDGDVGGGWEEFVVYG